MRVLCTGDIHIGRRASRLPEPLPGHLRVEEFSSSTAWSAVVDVALRERVDLVAISGDVVDRQNRFFEAVGPFEQGVKRLADEQIEVVAVSGNHDHDVLPVLARNLPHGNVTFLGAGGTWQRHTVWRDGIAVLHIDGWSFPAEHVPYDPLQSYPSAVGDGVPVLGLLHADLDQTGSRYAPTKLTVLRQTYVSAWVLGHIHQPRLIDDLGGPLVIYPGSPMAMDPGEAGRHGSWMLEIEPGQQARAYQLPSSPIQYQTLEIALDGIDATDDLLDHLSSEIRRGLEEIVDGSTALRYVSFRVRLTGRTRIHGNIDATLARLSDDLDIVNRGIVCGVERVDNQTQPRIDLADLVRYQDPTGEIARLLVALESDARPADYQGLLDRTVLQLKRVRQQRAYVEIGDDRQPDASDARRYLLQEGYRLLDTLLAQRERGPT